MFTHANLYLHNWLMATGADNMSRLLQWDHLMLWIETNISDNYDALCVIMGGEPI